jgi:hypothetical protein
MSWLPISIIYTETDTFENKTKIILEDAYVWSDILNFKLIHLKYEIQEMELRGFTKLTKDRCCCY